MKKQMYIVWKPQSQTAGQFRSTLSEQAARLLALGARKIRLTVADEDVAAAHKLRIISPQLAMAPGVPDAIISFWINCETTPSSVETILTQYCQGICGYEVSESEPLANSKYPTSPVQRTPGMNQVVLLRKPARLTREQWLDIWLKQHTPIAMATQSTFGYRQSVVTHPLTNNALLIDAIVEENFPPEAMTSTHAFYNAIGDDKLMRKNRSDMFASVQRFIDLDKLDCIPMSEYNLDG